MENKQNDLENLKTSYESITVPEHTLTYIEEGIRKAQQEKRRHNKLIWLRSTGVAAAAALLFVLLPNTNASIAMAMERIPLIGGIVKVVTIRDYQISNETHDAKVVVPRVSTKSTDTESTSASDQNTEELPDHSKSVNSINKSVEEYTDTIISEFEKDMEQEPKGHYGLDISYDVMTDTDDLFTLRINTLSIQASGAQSYQFYHINKMTDELFTLPDIFTADSDYISVISDEIKKQMREQMKNEELSYFLDSDMDAVDDFNTISPTQNFYIDNHQLVLVFDEYEVAPGYMGCPEFIISSDILKPLLNEQGATLIY